MKDVDKKRIYTLEETVNLLVKRMAVLEERLLAEQRKKKCSCKHNKDVI